MTESVRLLGMVPVLPSSDLERDIQWYAEKTGFVSASSDRMYAILRRNKQSIHLQWHANTIDDPLLGGSVVRIFVEQIQLLFEEFVERGTIDADKLQMGTAWGTNEFGIFDLNKNALFFVEDL